MRKSLLLFLTLCLLSCKEESFKQLQAGHYRVLLDVKDNEQLPIVLEVESPQHLKVRNADEVIEVDEIVYRNDSVFIKMPYFETYFAAAFNDTGLSGMLIEESRGRMVPFKAEYGKNNRFEAVKKPEVNVDGVWETTFSPGIEGDAYIAQGVFKQQGEQVTGTFRTTTGDYRFLEGVVESDTLKLSTFDGAHAFLFKAAVTDSVMQGMFYSGNHFKEPFIAKRNPDYELPDANTLTFLKEGYDTIDFEFPDLKGNMVSLSDERFRGKVVLVQMMGSYCPNCLDESKFYAAYYKTAKDKGLEIVALAVENAKTEAKAIERIKRMRDKVGINYPILLAQYGTNNKAKAAEKLPMLNHIMSYPTTVYIDRNGKVRKVHTGFNGPATGEKYEAFRKEFNDFVGQLLSE